MPHTQSQYPIQPLADSHKPWCILWLQSKGPFQFYDRDNDLVSDTTVDWNVFHRVGEVPLLAMSIEENSERVLMYDVTRPRRDEHEASNMLLGEQFIGSILDYCIRHEKSFEVDRVHNKGLWEKFKLPTRTPEKDTIYVTSEELKKIRSPQ